jgi:hypothetical protein
LRLGRRVCNCYNCHPSAQARQANRQARQRDRRAVAEAAKRLRGGDTGAFDGLHDPTVWRYLW